MMACKCMISGGTMNRNACFITPKWSLPPRRLIKQRTLILRKSLHHSKHHFLLNNTQPAQQALGSSGHEKKRARHTPRVSPPRDPGFSFAHYFQVPATQTKQYTALGKHHLELTTHLYYDSQCTNQTNKKYAKKYAQILTLLLMQVPIFLLPEELRQMYPCVSLYIGHEGLL